MNMNACCGCGLQGIKEDFVALFSRSTLDQMAKSLRGVSDKVYQLTPVPKQVRASYAEAKVLYAEALAKWGPELTGVGLVSSINPATMPAAQAYGQSKLAAKLLARQVQELNEIHVVFTYISGELQGMGLASDANGINVTMSTVLSFTATADKDMAGIPEYAATKAAIIAAFNAELKSAGISTGAINDPGWYAAFERAIGKEAPMPETGMGLVFLPFLFSLLALAAATATAIYALSRILPDSNAKAKTVRDLFLAGENQKAEADKAAADQKLYVELQMRNAGASEAAIKARMAEIDAEAKAKKDDIDARTKKKAKEVPESTSIFGSLLLPVGLLIGGAVALKIAKVI